MISALGRVDQAQQKLERSAKGLEAAIKRGIATEEQAVVAYLALTKSGIEYQSVLKGLEQNSKMLGAAHQSNINGLLGVDRASKSARDSASALSDAFKEQERQSQEALKQERQRNATRVALIEQRIREEDKAQKEAVQNARAEAAAKKELDRIQKSEEANLQRLQKEREEYNRTFLGTDRAVKSAKDSASAFKPILDSIEQDTKMAAQAAEEHNRQLLGVDRSMKSAKASADVFKAAIKAGEINQRQAAQAVKENAAAEAAANAERMRAQQSYNQLRMSIDKSYAARMRLKQAADTLRAAVKAEIITREQAIEQLRQYRATSQMVTAATGVGSAANQRASRKINEVGMAVQQTGYQVGDFLVQVQSGTNAFVAFGQQATQLVGILPMFASVLKVSVGTLIGISSALGIAIPLATALGAAFMRTRQEAESAADGVEGLSRAVDAYSESADKAAQSSEDLTKMYGDSADKARELFEVNKTLAELDAIDALKGSMISLRDTFGDFSDVSTSSLQETMKTFDDLGSRINKPGELSDVEFVRANTALEVYADTVFDLERKLGSTTEEAFNFAIELSKLSQAEGPREAASQLDSVRSLYFDIIGGAEGATDAQRKMLRELVSTAIEALNLKVTIENAGDATENTVGYSIDLLNVLKQITGLDIQSGFNDAAIAVSTMNSRLDLTMSKIGGILSAIGSIGFDTIAIEAEAKALEAGKSIGQSRIEGQIAQREAEMRQAGPIGAIETAGLMAYRKALEDKLAASTRRDEAIQAASDSGSGVGAAANPADSLRKSVNSLIASYDEQYAKTLKIAEATKTLADAQTLGLIPANMSADQILKDYIASLEQADDTMSQFVNDTASQMSDAFMSIVDGSKSASDAFEDMARAILKQAFELAVINPLINSIFGGATGFTKLPTMFANANGNAFNNGNVIPFANGGVVSSPTMFPMTGNQTGLMGEAGPEAIMPLKRGKGGKLGVVAEGASQPVVIHQNFNFSANGDDSVKRIIAEEAPKIANLTQKQIMDQRRRGGAMKATFG